MTTRRNSPRTEGGGNGGPGCRSEASLQHDLAVDCDCAGRDRRAVVRVQRPQSAVENGTARGADRSGRHRAGSGSDLKCAAVDRLAGSRSTAAAAGLERGVGCTLAEMTEGRRRSTFVPSSQRADLSARHIRHLTGALAEVQYESRRPELAMARRARAVVKSLTNLTVA